MKKVIILASALLANISWAQQQTASPSALPNIVPPSPTAYTLGNYGNVPVGLFTGTANLSVPLFTYKTNNITLPLNLFYGSNGIRVDEISSNVGLGWNLNFGGVITRTVRDRDDNASTKIPFPDNVSGGYSNPAALEFFYQLGHSIEALDTEADMYSFNFNGISGKFFYDKNGVPHLIDQQAIKIEKSNGFTLTLSNGEKYYFSATESTSYNTTGGGRSTPQSATTAWYLSKIVHPEGDEVYFTYELQTIPYYVASEFQTLRMTYPYSQNSCYVADLSGGTGVGDEVRVQIVSQSPTLSLISQNMVQTKGLRIKSINSNNPADGTVNFTYTNNSNVLDIDGNYKIQNIAYSNQNNHTIESVGFNYLNTLNKRNFLNSLIFKDPQKSYAFEYEDPYAFPQRLSYSQDYWGYYNGKGNTNLIPKNIPKDNYGLFNYNYQGADKAPDPNFTKLGMLKKITYPTKGYTELEYEGNTYWGEKTIYPDPAIQHMSVRNPLTGIKTQEFTFTSPADQRIEIETYNNTTVTNGDPSHFPRENIGLITDDISVKFYTWNQTSGQNVIPPDPGGNINISCIPYETETFYFDAKAGTTYKLILSSARNTFSKADVKYYSTAQQVVNTNLYTGGIRIKSTKDYDLPGIVSKYQRYYYAHKDDINHSSGNAGTSPIYDDRVTERTNCFQTFFDIKYLMLTSSSMVAQYDNNSSNYYRYVTVSNGGDQFENGGEMKEYTISRDNWGNNMLGNTIKSTPWTNLGWDNGQEKKSYILRKNPNSPVLDIIQEKENSYEMVQPQYFESRNYTARKNFDISYSGSPTSLGALDNLDIMEYKNISYWHYLKSQKTTEYLNGTPVVSQTEYFYNNPLHIQPTSQKVTFPDKSIQETTFQYAHEKGNQYLINKNIIGIPLETTVVKKLNAADIGKTISKIATLYPSSDTEATNKTSGLPLPISVSSLDIRSNTLATDVLYKQYSVAGGNILQYNPKPDANGNSSNPISIVWGYNNTLPIAKIEGANFAQISPYILAMVNASDADGQAAPGNDEATLVQALNDFRNNPNLAKFQITTYTYDPLIGVRSITPPSGIREVYKYDSMNRLQSVMDVNNNILKEFNYHYKN